MEWGQQMIKHQENARNAMYQNSNYSFERENRKTITIDHNIGTSITPFNLTLHEPLIIDKLSDIYLDSFITVNCLINSGAGLGFILDIDQFNIKNNSTNELLFDKIFIPNEASAGGRTATHKGKKLNYICSINPTKLRAISGSITNCPNTGGTIATNFSSGGRFIAEFVIIPRD